MINSARFAVLSLLSIALLQGCQNKTSSNSTVQLASANVGIQWDRANDPGRLFRSYQQNLRALPSSGVAVYRPWSDTYWPNYQGGAAFRWQLKSQGKSVTDPHYYRLLSEDEVHQASDDQLASLSPAEKYDIIQGRYDYPTVRREAQRTHPNDTSWWGLCHAVAMGNSNFREPQTNTFQIQYDQGDVKTIPLYSSDIKALLAMVLDDVNRQQASPMIGQKCETDGSVASSGACWDTNPASFYLAVTNMIGIDQRPLIIDVDPGAEVWNATAWKYSATITSREDIGSRAAPGTTHEVRVDMKLDHTIGASPSYDPNGGLFKTEIYSFTLELDDYDNVLGGEWLSKNRPDFVWQATPPRSFGGYYETLSSLLEPLN